MKAQTPTAAELEAHVRRLALAGLNADLSPADVYRWLRQLNYNRRLAASCLNWARAEYLRQHGAPQLPLEAS